MKGAPQFVNPFDAEPAFEDGTNVAAGTAYIPEFTRQVLPWYLPGESKPAIDWQDKWRRLQSRFERIIDEGPPFECVLVQSRIPAFGNDPNDLPPGIQSRTNISICNGLHSEPARLFGANRSPLKGVFPIKSAKGDPILTAEGDYVPFRFGIWRRFLVQLPLGLSVESDAQNGPRLMGLSRDATSLLYRLPSGIALSLWQNWSSGFSKEENSGESLWLDALFELSWQRQPGSCLYSKRYAWRGSFSVQVLGDGLFPRLPAYMSSQPTTSVPHEHGYPLAYYAKLEDVARASVAAIDELLERDLTTKNTDDGTRPAPVARGSAMPLNHQVMNTKRDKLFISYCHKDAKFLEDLLLHLKPFERAGLVAKWSDKQIAAGSQWLDEIQAALATTKVAVLMVTPGFLASDFIHENELTPLLKEAEQGGVRVLWVPVRASAYKETLLKNYQAVIPPDKPIAEMKTNRDKAWVKVCEEIKKALNPN
jgi:hypothetical protein